MGATQGCSQGFWGNLNNLEHWLPTGFLPTNLFNMVFNRAAFSATFTLLQAVNQPRGQLNALGRQAVAALLNAAHPNIDFPLTVNQVIQRFQTAFDSGVYGPTTDFFEELNTAFCPLRGGPTM